MSPGPGEAAEGSAEPGPAFLPEVTEVERLRMEPGDVLVLHLDVMRVSQADAQALQDRVQAVVGNVPLLILGCGDAVEVISADAARERT